MRNCAACVCAQVNDCHLCGLSRAEVATTLRDLPHHVRMVCARRKFSTDDKMSTIERLAKAKSEQSLASAPESASASLSRNKSRSLELLSKLNIWSNEPTVVHLIKGDGNLGFSILDDPVCMTLVSKDFVSNDNTMSIGCKSKAKDLRTCKLKVMKAMNRDLTVEDMFH